jgi:hypothetical protein
MYHIVKMSCSLTVLFFFIFQLHGALCSGLALAVHVRMYNAQQCKSSLFRTKDQTQTHFTSHHEKEKHVGKTGLGCKMQYAIDALNYKLINPEPQGYITLYIHYYMQMLAFGTNKSTVSYHSSAKITGR